MRYFLIILCFEVSVAFSQQKQPNILWITIEDTSPHFIGCYGNETVKTPNIDRLAREGVKFTNAFANSPVCSSSRSTIITGALNETLGTGNHRSSYPLPDYIKGFPTFLRDKGWYTSNNAKTDYATSDEKRLVQESWDESSKKAGWWGRAPGQPFFSIFNNMESHQSRTMTNPYLWYEKHVYEKLDSTSITGNNDFTMPPYFRDTPEMRKHFARVYNAIALTDRGIGLLLDSLESDGLMEETIIFLYADHGEAIPGGKSGSVGIGYKVPFIIWYPKKYSHLSPWGRGTVTNELVNFDDLGPTTLSLAGIKTPEYMTGRPVMGKFRRKPPPFIFTSRNRIDETPGLTRSITNGRLMYSKVFLPQFPELRYQKYADVSDIVRQIRRDQREGKLNHVQASFLEERTCSEYLYDLEADPWKLNNILDDPKYQAEVRELKNKLKEHILQVRDVMFIPEYSIDQFSDSTTPYEFRQTEEYHLRDILNAALMAGQEAKGNPLITYLDTKDPFVLYWAIMGLHGLQKVDWQNINTEIVSLMDYEYPPVQLVASMLAWEKYGNTKARAKIASFIDSDNPLIALQILQLLQYSDDNTFLDELEKMVAHRRNDRSFLNPVSAAETMLYYEQGRPLFYENMKKWRE